MRIVTESIRIETTGDGDLVDLTPRLRERLAASGLTEGQVTVFNVGSTAAILAFEYEPGLARDVRELFARLVPRGPEYHHDATWGDANGFSHLRAALPGPSLTVPFVAGELKLGTWQQVVLAEFDHRPRQREVVCQFLGR